jgi:O-antigen/teichoic acid export membrane protein
VPVPGLWAVLRHAGSLSVVQFVNRAVYSADALWIRALTGSDAAVALFFAASKVAQTAQIPVAMLSRLFQPHLAHAVAEGATATVATVERIVRSAAYLTVPLALGGALVAGDLLAAIHGAEFAAAGPVLVLLLISVVFISTGSWYGQTLFARKEHRPYLAILVLGTAVNVVCSLWWVPVWGAAGSAAATAVATAVSSTTGLLMVRRRVPVVWWRPLLRPGLLAACVGAAVLSIPAASHVFARVGVGALAFAALLYWLELRHGGWRQLGAGLQRSSGFLKPEPRVGSGPRSSLQGDVAT